VSKQDNLRRSTDINQEYICIYQWLISMLSSTCIFSYFYTYIL
jgi:hypothetical protein